MKSGGRHCNVVSIGNMCGDGAISRHRSGGATRQLHPQYVTELQGVLIEHRQVLKMEGVGSVGPGAMLQVRTGVRAPRSRLFGPNRLCPGDPALMGFCAGSFRCPSCLCA